MSIESKLEIPEYFIRTLATIPSNESLRSLQKYNEKLLEEVGREETFLEETRTKLLENTNQLKSFQHIVDEKKRQIKKEKESLELDTKAEDEWLSLVKSARKDRLTGIFEYQNEMAEFRAVLYSTLVFNEDQVQQQISKIKDETVALLYEAEFHEQLLSIESKKNFESDAEQEMTIDLMNTLIQEMKIKRNLNKGEIKKLETELYHIDEEMSKLNI